MNLLLDEKKTATYSEVPNRRVGWNKGVGGKIAGNLINKLGGIKELVGNCTKAKNELVRKFSNFITLKIENHFNSKITLKDINCWKLN